MLINNLNDIIMKMPNIKLCYDKIIHTKVCTDYYTIIPKGIKCIIWFTYYNNNNVCFMCYLDNKKKIIKISIEKCCFSNELSYGTIIYGTSIKINNNKYFCCENIHYYKGSNIENMNYEEKLHILLNFFKNDTNNININNFLKLTLPIINKNYYETINIIKYLPYKVYSINFINKNINNYVASLIIFNNKIIKEAIFMVKSCINFDLYNLYCINNNKIQFYDTTIINTYKSSVMMNNLFRNIKENKNLDLLEESDNESDFEDVRKEKYVNFDKEVIMKCVYNNKFKSWFPIEKVNNKNIFNIQQIKSLEI